MPDTFTYDGTPTYSATYGFARMTGMPDQSLPDPSLDVQDRGGAAGGSVVQGVSYKTRFLPWTLVLNGTSPANLMTVMDNFKTLLNPANGAKLLVASAWTDLGASLNRGAFAVLNGPINTNPAGDSALILQLNWLIARPFWVTATEQGQADLPIASNPDSVVEPAAGVVLGTQQAEPVFTVKNTSGFGNATITIENETTGESLTQTNLIPNNGYFRCDTERPHCEVSNDGVVWTNGMVGVADDQPFLHLQPGVQNTITVSGLSSAELSISYRGLFL